MTNIISDPEDKLDEGINVLEILYGKYDKARLADNEFSDCFQFPVLK